MKRIAFILIGSVALLVQAAQRPMTQAQRRDWFKNLTPAEREKIELEALRKTGGVVEIEGKGTVYVYNCQDAIKDESLRERLKMLEYATHIKYVIERGTYPAKGFPSLPNGVPTAIWVVDNPELPQSLIQMEGPWGVVNVAALKADKPSEEVLVARFKKEFTRVAIYTFGGLNSSSKHSPVHVARDLKELDALTGQNITMDYFQGINRTLKDLGLVPGKKMSYRAACAHGLAPAPTNEFQKAVWEQVKAEKERGPTNPITIPPPNAKK
ncbi:MAG: hypothetical protein IJJ84_07725 [Kiritimatiellae bacterium]|nr:hypothetical protein [Kiritimatiellia bacterium]